TPVYHVPCRARGATGSAREVQMLHVRRELLHLEERRGRPRAGALAPRDTMRPMKGAVLLSILLLVACGDDPATSGSGTTASGGGATTSLSAQASGGGNTGGSGGGDG